ncbi:MAG: sigma factor, partial [Bacillota bacterium]
DELSVAWLALNEAIDQFRPGSGTSFLAFAKVVIRRRLVDYFRQEGRQAIPMSQIPPETMVAATLEPVEEEQERGAELAEFGSRLRQFGLTLREIAAEAPRRDARQTLVKAAATLVAHDELMAKFYAQGRVPISDLAKRSGVHPKAIERGRKYLIAVALILDGDYPYLQEYLRPLLGDIRP